VEVDLRCGHLQVTEDWYQEIKRYGHRNRFAPLLKRYGHRNRFAPLLKASDPLDVSPRLGIWSRALATVSAEPDALFHVLCNKPKLVGSTVSSQKRKRND
jgi:hypothetical protein